MRPLHPQPQPSTLSAPRVVLRVGLCSFSPAKARAMVLLLSPPLPTPRHLGEGPRTGRSRSGEEKRPTLSSGPHWGQMIVIIWNDQPQLIHHFCFVNSQILCSDVALNFSCASYILESLKVVRPRDVPAWTHGRGGGDTFRGGRGASCEGDSEPRA